MSGRAGCTREGRTEGARVVRDVCEVRCCAPRPRIRSALGICWARGKHAVSAPESPQGPRSTSDQIWLGHHGHPCAPLIALDGAPLYTDVDGGGWTAHRDSCIRWAVLDLPLPTAKSPRSRYCTPQQLNSTTWAPPASSIRVTVRALLPRRGAYGGGKSERERVAPARPGCGDRCLARAEWLHGKGGSMQRERERERFASFIVHACGSL